MSLPRGLRSETKKYPQLYCKNWENLPIFKNWLRPVQGNRQKAYCILCEKEFRAHRTDLRSHAQSNKHQRNEAAYEESILCQVKLPIMEHQGRSGHCGGCSRSYQKMQLREETVQSEDDTVDTEDDAHSNESDIQMLIKEVLLPNGTKCLLTVPTPSSNKSGEEVSRTENLEIVEDAALAQNTDILEAPNKESLDLKKQAISTQVMDMVCGIPVKDLTVSLLMIKNKRWTPVCERRTGNDGCCTTFVDQGRLEIGRYKLHYQTSNYCNNTAAPQKSFFPFIEVPFDVSSSTELHHFSLMLSPYGYMVYRGNQ